MVAIIDTTGNYIIKPSNIYSIDQVDKNIYYASIYENQTFYNGLVTSTGQILTKYAQKKYKNFYPLFSDNLLAMTNKDSKVGFFDKKGEIAIPFIYKSAEPFKNSTSIVTSEGNRMGVIDLNGNYLIQPKFDKIYRLYNNVFKVSLNNNCGVIDSNNNNQINLKYQDIVYVNKNKFIIKNNNKWGFIDANDNILLTPKYEKIKAITSNIYLVQLNNKFGLIDSSGNILKEINFDNIIEIKKSPGSCSVPCDALLLYKNCKSISFVEIQ